MEQFIIRRKRKYNRVEGVSGKKDEMETKDCDNSKNTHNCEYLMPVQSHCCDKSKCTDSVEKKCGDSPSDCTSSAADLILLYQPLQVKWSKIQAYNLDCDYGILYSKCQADEILRDCEKTLIYNTGDLAKVHVYGKWHNIPRKQVAYGDRGLSYKFSGNRIPACPWIPLLEVIRDHVIGVTGCDFNFVLINRYFNGKDYMGEHKDNEKDLVFGHPIASLSLGQQRDFVFRYNELRIKKSECKIEPVKLELSHGSLLVMQHPTNVHWYHSLPQRRKLLNVRINMTFRKMVIPI